MRAGKLDRLIWIESPPEEQKDGAGAIRFDYHWDHPHRAQIIKRASEETQRPFGAYSESNITFRTRWISDLDLTYRIIFEDRIYEIKEITEIGRRRGLDIRAVAKGPRECE